MDTFINRKVKICGITRKAEADYLNEAGVDYAGFVQFVPKSKRNISTENAVEIIRLLDRNIKAVAVTIEPDAEEIKRIEAAGFDYIQIHGRISEELLSGIQIPVIKAFNVNDLSDYERFHQNSNVAGYIFDAQIPGSGKVFEWNVLNNIPHDEKPALLAGGLGLQNVVEALRSTGLAGADVSSGVENDNGDGKSREKIMEFVRLVRGVDCQMS